MKYSYRITKYGPLQGDDWTSFHDIGNSVSEEEYLLTETDYINTVISICRCLGASYFTVNNLEFNSEGEPYTEGQEVEVDRLAPVLTVILRERMQTFAFREETANCILSCFNLHIWIALTKGNIIV